MDLQKQMTKIIQAILMFDQFQVPHVIATAETPLREHKCVVPMYYCVVQSLCPFCIAIASTHFCVKTNLTKSIRTISMQSQFLCTSVDAEIVLSRGAILPMADVCKRPLLASLNRIAVWLLLWRPYDDEMVVIWSLTFVLVRVTRYNLKSSFGVNFKWMVSPWNAGIFKRKHNVRRRMFVASR